MTAKEFLSQARYLDMRINSKVEQIESLNDLATKCTSTITGMPRNPSASTSLMADAISFVILLEASQMKKQIHLEGITKRIKEKETESILSL